MYKEQAQEVALVCIKNKLKRLLKRLALTDPLKLLQEHNKGKGNFTKEKKHRVVTMLELNMRYPSHV